jgi:VWFA-related protein
VLGVLVSIAAGAQTPPAQEPPAPVQEAPAADEPPAAEETFYEAIQVRTAEVEVVVTDRQGNRVAGLQREDFTLFEDGKAVELTGFAAYDAAMPAAAPATPATAEPPAPPRTEPAAAPPPPSASVVVLLDNQSLTLSGRKRLLDHARRLIAELGPEHRIGVSAQDAPGRLRVVLPPTTDRAAVLAALDRAADGVPGGNQTYVETQQLAREIANAPDPAQDARSGLPMAQGDAEGLYHRIITHAAELEVQALSTADALEQLVEALAGLPGRKAVVLISGGIPQRPAEALMSAWRNRFDRMNDQWNIAAPSDDTRGDVSTTLARTAAHANGSRVAIYGLVSPAVPAHLSADMSAGDVWTGMEETKAIMNLQDSMTQLALPTGGVAGFDQGATLAVSALTADLESYYSLAYTPRERKRGKDHDLRVEVTHGQALRVRHRNAQRERTSAELMSERTRAALLFGWQDNPLDVAVDVGAPTRGERRGTTELPLTITLPMSRIVLVPQGAAHEGRLTIHIAATDAEGRSSPVSTVDVPVRVPNDQLLAAMSQLLAYRTRLAVRPTRQQIAVTVRDELANQAATVLVEHQPGAPVAQAPAASQVPAAAAAGGPD